MQKNKALRRHHKIRKKYKHKTKHRYTAKTATLGITTALYSVEFEDKDAERAEAKSVPRHVQRARHFSPLQEKTKPTKSWLGTFFD